MTKPCRPDPCPQFGSTADRIATHGEPAYMSGPLAVYEMHDRAEPGGASNVTRPPGDEPRGDRARS